MATKAEIATEISEITGQPVNPKSYSYDKLEVMLQEAKVAPIVDEEPEAPIVDEEPEGPIVDEEPEGPIVDEEPRVTVTVIKGCIVADGRHYVAGDEVSVELLDDIERFQKLGIIE